MMWGGRALVEYLSYLTLRMHTIRCISNSVSKNTTKLLSEEDNSHE